ncbi:integrase core domain-containing protein [Frankia sp. CcWB2]
MRRVLPQGTHPHPPLAHLVDLKRKTADWIENYFNTTRRHSSLEYLTPREYEPGHRNISQLAA